MARGRDLIFSPQELADDLRRRGSRFYHAINLPDFKTYARAGALLSRAQLRYTSAGIGTDFASDKSDMERGLFDRCFGNLSDFGKLFWEEDIATPNVYGPITLDFAPDVYRLMVDVAVTEKNAGDREFDLSRDRIQFKTAWRSLFVDSDSGSLVLGGKAFFSEISTSTNTLPFEFLENIWVEPLCFGGIDLIDCVRKAAGQFASRVVLRDSSPLSYKQGLFADLIDWSAERGGRPPRSDLVGASTRVAEWWKRSPRSGACHRWFQYIVSTLREMAPDAVEPPAVETHCEVCEERSYFRCDGCGRELCRKDYFGPSEDTNHDAVSQCRCWECAHLRDDAE